MRNFLVFAAALFVLGGCSGNGDATKQVNDAEHQVENAAREFASSAPGHAAADALLAAGIRANLVSIDVDSATDVRVAVHGGVAVLGGSAPSTEMRARYAAAARKVSGVTAVRDELRIDPSKRGSAQRAASDLALDAQVLGVIVSQAGFNALHVQASANRGVVTVSGTAPSDDVKRTIVRAARSVSGVKALVDHVRVVR